ncbi:TBCB-like protein, partial [Mya arenaria]
MAQEFSVVTQSMVGVTITSSANTFGSERRFPKDITIADLKGKLVLLTGADVGSMKLELYTNENKLVCPIDNDNALLGSYPIDDGMRLHVIDPNAKLGEFEDVSKVEKFELSAEEYAKRGDSVRAFKERNKMGRFREITPEEKQRQEEEQRVKEEQDKAAVEAMKIGDRCEVSVPGQPARRGCVKYAGKQYFQCPDKYGGFVKPENVQVGDFPEEGFEDMEDDE